MSKSAVINHVHLSNTIDSHQLFADFIRGSAISRWGYTRHPNTYCPAEATDLRYCGSVIRNAVCSTKTMNFSLQLDILIPA